MRLCLLHTPKIKYAIFCKTFSHRGPVKELMNVFYIRKGDATILVHLTLDAECNQYIEYGLFFQTISS